MDLNDNVIWVLEGQNQSRQLKTLFPIFHIQTGLNRVIIFFRTVANKKHIFLSTQKDANYVSFYAQCLRHGIESHYSF